MRLACALMLGLATGCAAGSTLPPPREPLTPTPDADFRARAPAPLSGVASWQPPQLHVRTLANGMQLYVVERPGLPIASVRYVNRAAVSRYPGEKPGLSVLVGDALLEGTRMADNQVAAGLRIAGSRPSVWTGDGGSWVEIDLLAGALPAAIETLARVVQHPAFHPQAVAKSRQQQHDWLFDASKRGSMVQKLVMGVLYGDDHPWAMQGRRIQRGLASITTADVRRFHADVYTPAQSALVVAGDVRADQVFAIAERHFGPWQARERKHPQVLLPRKGQQRRVHAIYDGGDQTRLLIVQPAVGIAHPDRHALELLSQILGGSFRSRADVALRHHQGATYGVNARVLTTASGGHMEIRMAVDNRAVFGAVETIRSEIARIQASGVSEAELAAAREAYLSGFELTTTRQLTGTLMRMYMYGLPLSWLEGAESSVREIRPEHVQKVARDYLDANNHEIIAMGDYHQTRNALERLGKVQYYQITPGG